MSNKLYHHKFSVVICLVLVPVTSLLLFGAIDVARSAGMMYETLERYRKAKKLPADAPELAKWRRAFFEVLDAPMPFHPTFKPCRRFCTTGTTKVVTTSPQCETLTFEGWAKVSDRAFEPSAAGQHSLPGWPGCCPGARGCWPLVLVLVAAALFWCLL